MSAIQQRHEQAYRVRLGAHSVGAYQLFEDRGHEPGSELNDWLKAEQEIKRRLGL
jgi:hypothetical protein